MNTMSSGKIIKFFWNESVDLGRRFVILAEMRHSARGLAIIGRIGHFVERAARREVAMETHENQ